MANRIWWKCVTAGWLLAACNSTPATDAGAPGSDAGPPPDLPPVAANREGPDDFEPVDVDLACLGMRSRPTPGADIEFQFQLRDFQDDFEVNDIEVWFFPGNDILDSCDSPTCTLLETDAAGHAMVTAPANGWYAYRVLPFVGRTDGETVFGVFQYNEPAPSTAGDSVVGNSVSGITINVIPGLLGIVREEGRAIVAGRLEDCNENFVENAIVRIYDPDGNLVPQGSAITEPSYHYFNGNPNSNLPDQTLTDSNVDGLYVVVQVPIVDERPYRMEAWANVGGTFTRISCETARIFPDAVTILNLGPERADRPAACN